MGYGDFYGWICGCGIKVQTEPNGALPKGWRIVWPDSLDEHGFDLVAAFPLPGIYCVECWGKIGVVQFARDVCVDGKLEVPWGKPISVYDTDGPKDGSTKTFKAANSWFMVSPTNETGMTTGRTRFSVSCLTCGVVLHRKTTGPKSYIEGHLKKIHGCDVHLEYAWEER